MSQKPKPEKEKLDGMPVEKITQKLLDMDDETFQEFLQKMTYMAAGPTKDRLAEIAGDAATKKLLKEKLRGDQANFRNYGRKQPPGSNSGSGRGAEQPQGQPGSQDGSAGPLGV